MALVVLTITGAAVLGGIYGRGAAADEQRIEEQMRAYTSALGVIESRYVDKVESDRLVYGSISGMLQTLDPHSSFMDPKAYAQLRERQEGRYYGLGITIQVVDGDITVVSLFEGSPAYQKGIRRGDVIAEIETANAKGWTSDQAIRKLRGPKGTSVKIALRRVGYDQLIPLEVPRDEIHIPSIPAFFMVDGGTGYVRLQDFAENTDRDLSRALQALGEQGMKRLLLDLRGNPGGPLDQAIRVSNRFLPRGDLIVYTRGRVPNSDADYRAQDESDYTHLPIVVLVNRSSASASEIVSGALQDHDRAYIVGETTFGKALVQSVYKVTEGAGLALTTARYYTPSGRLIQRAWDGTFDEYLTYTLRDQKAERPHDPKDLKYTEAGRKVYSGGGIEPDRHIEGPIEGFNPGRFARSIYGRQLFGSYSQRFSVEGDTRIQGPGKDRRTVAQSFEVDEAMVDDFRKHVTASGLKMDDAAFTAELPFIRAMIRYEIDVSLFGVATARRHLVATDPQAQAALGLFGEAERLTELARAKASRAGAK
jgi:carboxyl-terminal processing protease